MYVFIMDLLFVIKKHDVALAASNKNSFQSPSKQDEVSILKLLAALRP